MGDLAAWTAGAAAAFFAVLMPFQRSLYASAVCLMAALLQSAVLVYLSGAPLLAFLQVMIYAGGVMVLIVISIMAASPGASRVPAWASPSVPRPLFLAVVLLPAAQALWLAWRGLPEPGRVGAALAAQDAVGPVLFGPYAAATEAVTLLLMLAGLGLVSSREEAR